MQHNRSENKGGERNKQKSEKPKKRETKITKELEKKTSNQNNGKVLALAHSSVIVLSTIVAFNHARKTRKKKNDTEEEATQE